MKGRNVIGVIVAVTIVALAGIAMEAVELASLLVQSASATNGTNRLTTTSLRRGRARRICKSAQILLPTMFQMQFWAVCSKLWNLEGQTSIESMKHILRYKLRTT